MPYFVISVLAFLILLGLLEIFIALKYPRGGAKSAAQKVGGKMFKRGFLTITFCSTALGLLLSNVLDQWELLIITLGILLLSEYGIAITTPR